MRNRLLATVLIFLSRGAIAQTDVPHSSTVSTPKFDVAVIKPAAPGARGMFIRPTPGGRITVTNMTLKMLVEIAYRLQDFQVSAGPSWLDSEHFDIEAKPDQPGKQSDWPVMLQGLLTDRFQLTFHRETKELPVYALVPARKDGKLGPGMTESKEGDCTPFDPSKPEPPKPGEQRCGTLLMGPGRLTGVHRTAAELCPVLSRVLGRMVVDQTGLRGNFNFTMNYTADENQIANVTLPGMPPPPPPSDAAGPSLFTALQEQLGLKLEAQKGPVEIFVIDRGEKPSEN